MEVEDLCKDLLLTEAAYAADLAIIRDLFVLPLRKLQLLSSADSNLIFSNYEELLELAQQMLMLLQRKGDPVTVMTKALGTVAPFFRIYSTYCTNYAAAVLTVRECQQRPTGFAEFLASQAQRKEVKGLSLESFLIKPVQRLTKYPLFFTSLMKKVPPEHESRSKLEKADALVREVANSVDSALMGDELQQLLRQLGPEFMALLEPTRKVLAPLARDAGSECASCGGRG